MCTMVFHEITFHQVDLIATIFCHALEKHIQYEKLPYYLSGNVNTALIYCFILLNCKIYSQLYVAG